MLIRKFVIFFIVLAFAIAFSQRNAISRDGKLVVTIKPRGYIVSQDNIVDFIVEVESENTDLQTISIRPKTEIGLTSVYSPESDTWISQNSSWTDAPEINDVVKVKIVGIHDKTKLKFQIQNKLDGKIYETEEITVYGRNDLKAYTEKINANLRAFEIKRQEDEHEIKDNKKIIEDSINGTGYDPPPASTSGFSKKYLIIYAVIFLTSAVMGFAVHKYRSNIVK